MKPKVKIPIELQFEAEIYTAVDNKGRELKSSGDLDKMYNWARRHNYVVVEVTGLDDDE